MLLHVITHLDLGGAEEVALALTEQLYSRPSGAEPSTEAGAATDRAYDVHFFAVNGIKATPVGQAMKRRLDRIGVPVHSGSTLELKRGGFVQAAARLAALTWRLRPDIVHLHTEIPELTHALSRGFLNNAPRVPGRALLPSSPLLTRTLHNTSFWGPWQRMGVQVERRLTGVPLVACSEAALTGMRRFRSENGLAAPSAEQARVILNGVAPARAVRQATPEGPVRVMFAGRLEAQKGADLLPGILNAAAAFSHPAAELTIYGAGSLHPELARWAEQGAPNWKITLLPPTPDLRERMAQHDLLLMPSRFEGLPLMAAEALMAGLPVIGTRADGMAEVFSTGYPLLAPSEDVPALGSLLAEVLNHREQTLEQARQWVQPTAEKFGVARMAREYDAFYRQLLQNRAPVSRSPRLEAL